MVQTLCDNRKSNPYIKLHAIHLPPSPDADRGLQVMQFCTGAIGTNWRFLWSIIPSPLTDNSRGQRSAPNTIYSSLARIAL